MGVKDWPVGERPRERLIRLGAGALSDGELAAVLLGSGVRGRSAVDVGRELVADGWPRLAALAPVERMQLFTTRSACSHTAVHYQRDDWLIFGRESIGLPPSLLDAFLDRTRRIPMRPVTGARSLNLSNAVVIVLYEALRQQDFPGLS